MRRILTAVVVTAAMGCPQSRAEEAGAAFLRISPSVTAEALGGMNPAAGRGAQAVGVNPANLALSGGGEVTSGFATLIGDSSYGTVGLAVNRSRLLTVGAQATYLQSGRLEGRDSQGNLTEDFQARDVAAGLSASLGGESFRVGGTIKAIRQQIGELTSDTAPALDAGLAFRTGQVLWGAAALNLGSGIKFQGREEALPAIYSLGASLPLGGGLTGLAGVVRTPGETAANLGLEFDLKPLRLRAGYRSAGTGNLAKDGQKGSERALGGLTAGMGIEKGGWRLDYAVGQTAVEYGLSHRAAVTWRWGVEEASESAPARRRFSGRTAAPAQTGGVKSGSRRAYDPAPIKKVQKRRKTWVR